MLDGSETIAETRCLADVAPEPIKWLWPRRFALGKLNILAGQPGLGKSQITAAMAGIVTRGATWPDGSRSPHGAVLFVCCEDDAADTISPRLEAAGADRRKVYILDWILEGGTRRTFDVGRDAEAVRRESERIGNVVLIVIDPVSAYLGSADSHKTSDVRGALAPLQSVAADIGACILLVSHLNKGGGDMAAMSRVTGSGAFVAAARSAWIVGEHPDDDGKRALVPLKNNIGDDKTGFAYQIEGRVIANGIETSRVAFGGALQLTAESVLKVGTGDTSAATALAEAEAFLRAELSDGAMAEAKELKRRAEAAGIAWRTIERAKPRVGVRTGKQHGARGAWCWHIPIGNEQDRQGCQDHRPPRHGDGGCEVATADVCHANPSADPDEVGGLGGVV